MPIRSLSIRSNRLALPVGLALAAGLPFATAQAAVSGIVTYNQPTGTAAATDSIPIVITLTLAASSDRLTVVNNTVTQGYTAAELTNLGLDPNNGSVNFGSFMTCSSGAEINSFIGSDCASGPYNISFGSIGNFSLGAGESLSATFGNFVPKGGVAPGGTYTLYDLGFNIDYQPANGGQSTNLAQLSTSGPGTFVRTVAGATAVPEAATWAMMLIGFGIVGLGLRRRSPKRATI